MAFYDNLTPTIYAAPTNQGTGSGTSEANAINLPAAMAMAVAGDVVGCQPGVYTAANTHTRWVPAFRFSNSGTVGAPIILVGKYDHILNYANPLLRCEFRTSGYDPLQGGPHNCAVLGSQVGQVYTQYRNVFINAFYVPPRSSNGMIVISGGATGTRVRKVAFKLTEEGTPATGSDNYNAIFSQDNVGMQVDYNYFYGQYGVSANQNWASITTYSAENFVIDNNTFEDFHNGIFIKGSTTNHCYGAIRKNKFIDGSSYGISLNDKDATNQITVTQNLAVRCLAGIHWENSGNPPDGLITVTSNTVVDCTTNGNIDMEQNTLSSQVFRDNISAYTASTSQRQFVIGGTMTASVFGTLDYNLYYESGATAQFYQNGTTYTGIGAWRTATGKETNSSEGNPNFFNAALDDYRLATPDFGSSTGGARGCYITGLESIGAVADADTTPPAAPTGVTIS